MANIYTTCDEIPLCKFIEMYKGNLNALIKGGRTKPTDGELRKAAMGLIDEYSVITGNKNIAIEIEEVKGGRLQYQAYPVGVCGSFDRRYDVR